jgi:hypothetical protein
VVVSEKNEDEKEVGEGQEEGGEEEEEKKKG